MKTVLSVLTLTIIVFALSGCQAMEKDLLWRENHVVVASCPSDISITVNNVSCVTPCKLKFPGDTEALVVTYNNKSTVVYTEQSGLHGYPLSGSLMILDPDNIGKPDGAPNTTYFLRDYRIGLSHICAGS